MKKYDVAAFVWPSYTGDEPRTRIFWPEGYGEWQTVKNIEENASKKRDWLEKHWMKRKPLWGYVNEANADVMQMQIDCAVSHGVNVFIYDWYWYDGRPFLENCLNDGFLKAKNNDKMKFYLMWANHDVNYMWDVRNAPGYDGIIWTAGVTKDEYKMLVDRWIDKYFKHPSYYKINGCPVFMLYYPDNFIKDFCGLEGAKEALDYFREKTVEAGFPGLHLQLVGRGIDKPRLYPFTEGERTEREIIEYLGFDSLTHYQWRALSSSDSTYESFMNDVMEEYERIDNAGVTYFPHVSLGWDNNPRYKEYSKYVVTDATPDKIEIALRKAKKYADTHNLPAPLITVNSWNEWTETSYLEPDELYGYGYLEAVKRVFCEEKE